MKFSEERPNVGDIIEALFPDGEWYKVEYSNDGADGSLWHGNVVAVTDLDEYPDLQWRSIEGEDMSRLLEGLPDKKEPDPVHYRVFTYGPATLDEFLAQFGACLMRDDDDDYIFRGNKYIIQMPIREEDQQSVWAAYIIQQVLHQDLGSKMEEVQINNMEEIND